MNKRMRLSIVNCASKSTDKCRPKVNEFVKKMDSRRKIVEQSRRSRLDRIHKDVNDIFEREKEYTKKMIEQLVPVKIVWDEEGLDRLMNLMPFRFEKVEKEKVHEPEIVDEEEVLEETV